AATGAGRGTAALRASLGLGSTAEHVDRLAAALRELVTGGPRWRYAVVEGRWAPDPDPRRAVRGWPVRGLHGGWGDAGGHGGPAGLGERRDVGVGATEPGAGA